MMGDNIFIKDIDQFRIAGAKIGTTLRIRLPNDYMRRAVAPLPPPVALPEVSAGAAAVLGAAAVIAKNPVVSRRFWSR